MLANLGYWIKTVKTPITDFLITEVGIFFTGSSEPDLSGAEFTPLSRSFPKSRSQISQNKMERQTI